MVSYTMSLGAWVGSPCHDILCDLWPKFILLLRGVCAHRVIGVLWGREKKWWRRAWYLLICQNDKWQGLRFLSSPSTYALCSLKWACQDEPGRHGMDFDCLTLTATQGWHASFFKPSLCCLPTPPVPPVPSPPLFRLHFTSSAFKNCLGL